MKPTDRIYVPLDTPDLERGLALVRELAGLIGGVKIGKEFFTALGPQGVARVAKLEMPLFLDLKFHDIPNTVAGAVRSGVHLHPTIIDVHAQGGRAMMQAAAEAARDEAAKIGIARPLMLGVTVLTSLDASDLNDIGVVDGTQDQVVRLARLASVSGLDGVVCSGEEIVPLRAALGPDFKLLVPGIRPAWSVTGDQKRILTPGEAVRRGADFLVIGRAITDASEPRKAAQLIADEIAEVVGA